MSKLIETSKQQAQDRDQALLAALAVPGAGTAGIADLARATGIPERSVRNRVQALVSAGVLVRPDGPRGPVALAPQSLTSPSNPSPATAPAGSQWAGVEALADALWPAPCYAHRALQRLHAAAVAARWTLREARPDDHLAFVSRGDEGTGKTAAYVATGTLLLGLRHTDYRITPGDTTAAELTGLRSTGAGGARTRHDAPWARQPLVVLDDADGHDAEVRKAFWPYLSGSTVLAGDRQLWPTAAVTYNPRSGQDPDDMLKKGWRRRSVLLDADYALTHRAAIRDSLGAYWRRPAAHRQHLDLTRLPAPPTQLGESALGVIASVRNLFANPEQAAVPAIGLELATLGRLALTGDGDQSTAVIGVVLDYALVTSTTGQLRDDWLNQAQALRDWVHHNGCTGLAVALEQYDAAAAAEHAARGARRRARHVEDDVLTRDRGTLVGIIDQAHNALDGRTIKTWSNADKASAKGLRAVLAKLRTDAGHTKSRAALDDVAARAKPHLAEVDQLLNQIDQTRRDVAQQQLQARQDAKQRRDMERRYAVAAKEQRSQQLRELRTLRRDLTRLHQRTTTHPGENPLRALQAIDLGGYRMLSYEPPAPPPTSWPGWREAITRDLLGIGDWGTWRSTDDRNITFEGRGPTGETCPRLAEWGQGTRAVLAAAITGIDRRIEQAERTHTGTLALTAS